ncbi:phosphoribosyl-ATP diphosphatase [Roseomonas sp. CECT 9278]|uniref:phosphoribosyl-ATP diphosphatase n=1 Tax=Roseomonas sp. CECT 9278 TaxID=2845823 RepID=UPI001E44F77E|nr:phosphoribosyl-ATP diphosphatase [Roseomonas sp. CECT 9278]CAH0146249.1 Phosphoribosyl-ATP pyrophosphatase [Roseomonas sp. CECT 9278]
MAKTAKRKPAAKKAVPKKSTAKKAAPRKLPKGERVPVPAIVRGSAAVAKAKLPKPVRKAEQRLLAPLVPAIKGADAAILDRLWQVVEARRQSGDAGRSHSARLLARGTAKVAQKLGEEAVECVIEAAVGNRAETVLESADLLYHLVVVWVDAGIAPQEVWAELARRQGISGIAEKAARPQGILRAAGTRKLP